VDLAARYGPSCRRDTADDFEAEVVPLLSQGAEFFDASKMSLESFRVAASWIGSRAFGVDAYHGALCRKAHGTNTAVPRGHPPNF